MERLANIIGLLFLFSELVLMYLKRSKDKNVKIRKDRASVWVLWITIGTAVFAGMFLAQMFPRNERVLLFDLSGIVIVMLGIIIRWTAIYQLGKEFTVDVSIALDHKLNENGFYKIIRHPSYLGLLLEFLGLSLLFNSWYPLVAINVPIFIALSYRIKIEEELLVSTFGETYINYKSRTKRLIPFIY